MPPRPSKRVAVFDIDGTIYRSSFLRELLENLISFGIFPNQARAYYTHAYLNWLDRKGSYEVYLEGIIKAYKRYIRGVQQHTVWDAARHVMDFHEHRVYRFTRNLVRDLKKKDYYLLAISGSPLDIVDQFARNFGFDEVYGRMFEVDKEEKFTGKIPNQNIIDRKGVILKRAVEKQRLTLIGSIGVGDTESDIPFLKLVARPIAFNPNRELYDYAKKYNWEIVLERKDMLYRNL
jgi:HAD superfamily hydrolase (TIGR01490 family)